MIIVCVLRLRIDLINAFDTFRDNEDLDYRPNFVKAFDKLEKTNFLLWLNREKSHATATNSMRMAFIKGKIPGRRRFNQSRKWIVLFNLIKTKKDEKISYLRHFSWLRTHPNKQSWIYYKFPFSEFHAWLVTFPSISPELNGPEHEKGRMSINCPSNLLPDFFKKKNDSPELFSAHQVSFRREGNKNTGSRD